MRVADGEKVGIEGLSLDTIYTPGHTNDSYSFLMGDRVFTGDTLLIRGTGRTDFQNGNAADQYHSIFDRLLKLPEETLVYPAHDYKGDTVSTIGEEKTFNPRLQVTSLQQYVDIMNNLKLPNPKMMDVAIPANLKVGLEQDRADLSAFSIDSERLMPLLQSSDNVLIDLRDRSERTRHGVIPGSVHAPYSALPDHLAPGGLLFELGRSTGRRLVFYCAFGERSAMAVEAARQAGLSQVCHLKGGLNAWKQAQGPLIAA
jgi:rhodanese-related sulfurtransferase